jgi:hypothetical protein
MNANARFTASIPSSAWAPNSGVSVPGTGWWRDMASIIIASFFAIGAMARIISMASSPLLSAGTGSERAALRAASI